jgi:hypothetical protein
MTIQITLRDESAYQIRNVAKVTPIWYDSSFKGLHIVKESGVKFDYISDDIDTFAIVK